MKGQQQPDINLETRIIFLYNTDEDLQKFQSLNTKGNEIKLLNINNPKDSKLAFKYTREYRVNKFPFILIYKGNKLKKIFIQHLHNDAMAEFVRYINNEPKLTSFNEMFFSFINKCKNHDISKQEVLHLINKYYT